MRIHLILVSALSLANCRPQEAVVTSLDVPRNSDENSEQTPRPPIPVLRESMKMLTNQLMETEAANFTMDTRTPPKIRLQHRNQINRNKEENSHPGVAVPVDVDAYNIDTTTKKNVNPTTTPAKTTTDGGFSTWILLSGQFTTTPKPKKPSIKPATQPTTTPPVTTMKPTPKARPSTKPTTKPPTNRPTPKPTTKPTTKTTTKPANKSPNTSTQGSHNNHNRKPVTTTPATTTDTKIMTKVKASVLNSAVKSKTTTPAPPTTRKVVRTTTARTTVKTTTTPAADEEDSANLEPEAKDGTVDLETTTTKKPSRTTNKTGNKKKNKNRRRKPETTSATMSNSTKIATKQKPIGTQIYNYFSREVMPTVGVGLVGLMVTAGLASYFLYPFGSLRRAYEEAIDRKDVYNGYEEYSSGGVPEEEAFGKVIEGMENTDYSVYGNELGYKQNSYYPTNDYSNNNNNWGYGGNVLEKETGYTVADRKLEQKYVVGNVPTDYLKSVTPVTVPEHGPRSLRIRRDAPNYKDKNIKDNEIPYEKPTTNYYFPPHIRPLQRNNTTETPAEIPSKQNVTENYTQQEYPNFFNFFRNLIEMKVRMGLEFLLRTTDTVNKYLKGVQSRVEEVLREKEQRRRPVVIS